MMPNKNVCIVGGDINLDLIKYEDKFVNDYFTVMSSNNFNPYITMPSRITAYSNTIIDHIFIKFPQNKCDKKVISGNILADITDHLPTFALLHFSKCNDFNSRPYIRILNDQNISSRELF